ncbi:MAG: choice-of-anchor L domain-containing protein [Polyangiaceae bacterium]
MNLGRYFVVSALVGVVSASAAACAKGGDEGTAGTADAGADTGGSFGNADAAKPCQPNEKNYDIPGNNCDDDGDGKIDNAEESCDDALPVTGSAAEFSRALGFCKAADGNRPGILSATFSNGFGLETPPADGQHGVLTKFGAVVKPLEGKSLGVLSTGWAREFDRENSTVGQFKGGEKMELTRGAAPPGFPKQATGCGDATGADVRDVVSFKVQLKAPANAQGLSFKLNFYSGEWPEFVCTRFNDGFVAMITSMAVAGGSPTNVSFDSTNSVISVNNGFFDRCTPNTQTGCAGDPPVPKTAECAAGTSELKGTGFGQPEGKYCGTNSAVASPGGSTGWLRTIAPVIGGETVTLEFILWDTGDQAYDSSILLDDFRWEEDAPRIGTDRPR